MSHISNLAAQLHQEPLPCVLAVSGGGTSAVSALLGVPGASRTVLEALVPYHPDALADFLGFTPAQACSAATARALARRAFDRASRLVPSVAVAGVGCTASLATDRPKRGEHRFHLSVQTRFRETSYSLTFHKGQRDRAGEEAVLDAILLNAIAETFGVADRLPVPLLPGEMIERESHPETDPLARLVAGELTAVYQEPDGQLRTDAPKPAALLCGSFNPLHDGHVRLAEVAARLLGVHVAFELTLQNADKPAMPIEEAERRARQFVGRGPLWFTAAPTFAAKSALFPGTTWVVGADTAARIVQPRFYGDESERDAALAGLCERGCRFLVAGREDAAGAFLSLDQIDMPTPFRDLFVAIPATDFHMEISSTELRSS
jgi:nicotinamide mononucleotide (NMN) deamidase PncC